MNHKSIEQLRTDAKDLLLHGIEAADGYRVMQQNLFIDKETLVVRGISGEKVEYDLKKFRRILVIGFGKVSGSMAYALEDILKSYIAGGVVIVKQGSRVDLEKIQIVEATHPVPDAKSIEGAQQVVRMLAEISQDDLVICLISGGGSALCTLPSKGIKLTDIQTITQSLLTSGADIFEVNTIRKHLSQIKGGQLAKLAYPASIMSLIISDVIGDRIDTIASGPTAPDTTTFRDAYDILQKYGLFQNAPASIRPRIKAGFEGNIGDTPTIDDRAFQKTRNIVIANNLNALRAIATKAGHHCYETLVLSSRIEGETRHVAEIYAALIKELVESPHPMPTPACITAGGEMTVRVTGKGKGGRNSDFCLALVPLISGRKRVVVLSAGTDGIDGSTDAAGGIIDGMTFSRAQNMGLDVTKALADHDSYSILKKSGDLLVIGPTGTNVMDIQLILIA
jgi:glycerate 2-kinase